MNNMNNFGMNPMGMNNMEMNNHSNLIDEYSLKIKSIFQQYENKIRELEQIIKQKDFEIANLKERLNNLTIPNPINMMMDDSNEKGKEISLSFINFKNDLLDKNCKFFENDMGYKLFDKILPDYHWNLIKFTNKERKIHPFITIKKNGIKDGSIIKSCFAINIHF